MNDRWNTLPYGVKKPTPKEMRNGFSVNAFLEFGLWDRIKMLFGRPIYLVITTYFPDIEDVSIDWIGSTIRIPPLFSFKQKEITTPIDYPEMPMDLDRVLEKELAEELMNGK